MLMERFEAICRAELSIARERKVKINERPRTVIYLFDTCKHTHSCANPYG